MARRRRVPSPSPPLTPQTQARSGGGLLSGVFSFVSREFESFVASATGAPPAASDSGQNLAEDDEEYDDDEEEEDEDDRRRRRRDRSPPHKRSRHARSRSRKRSPSPDSPPRRQRSTSRSHKRRRHRSPSSESAQESQSSSSQSRASSPETAPAPTPSAPLLRALKRRLSFTMPGSLFPRSPSMEPDFRPARGQHVRFNSSNLRPSSPPSPATPPPDSYQGSDVPPDPPRLQPSPSFSSPSTPNRRRTNVLSAADKFHVGAEDAGPSILLPSPHTSPTARGTTTYTATDKGKGRAIEDYHDGDTSGVLRVRGKEQELVVARQELDRHQRLLAEDQEDGTGETSFLEQVEKDRDRDKARIRMLEEEIARLKQELSKRPTTTTFTDRPYPPPPPPPPPPPNLPRKNLITIPTASDDPNLFASARASLKQAPPPVENPIVPARRTGIATVGLAPDKMAAFLNEMKTVRLRKTNSAPTRNGRDVHANGNATFVAPTPPSRMSQLAPRRSLEGLHERRPLVDEDAPMAPEEWEALRARVRAEMDQDSARVGEKRKRGEDVSARAERPRGLPTKRLSAIRPRANAGSANSSFASTSTSTSASSSSAQRGLPRRKSTPLSQPPQSQTQTQSQSQSQSSQSQPQSRSQDYALPPSPPSPPQLVRHVLPPATIAWQTSSVTSAPTPSLCSDNDNENERARHNGDDDEVPVTPPIGSAIAGGSGPSRSFFRFKGNGVPVEETEDRSMHLGRTSDRSFARDRSMDGSLDRSMNRSLNVSMSRSVGPGGDASQRSRDDASAAVNTSASAGSRAKAKARPLTSGIPRPKVRRAQQPAVRAPSPPARVESPPPPPQAAQEEQEQEQRMEKETGEERPSTFIRSRGGAPRANISFLAARPPTSPMPAKSPRRPRAPGRVSSRGSAADIAVASTSTRVEVEPAPPGHTPGIRRTMTVERYEYEAEEVEERMVVGHEEGGALLPPLSVHERTPSPPVPPRPASRARAAAPSQDQSQNQNQSRTSLPKQSKQPKTKAKAQLKSKAKLKRRLTLDEELRSAVPFLHEDDAEDDADEGAKDEHVDPGDAYMAEVAQQDADEVPHEEETEGEEEGEEDLDSGVLVGVGTRSKRRGFLAHGGAGGPPVFMGVGYVEGAEEDEEQGDAGEYTDEAQYEEDYDDTGDGDDDEYLPSPELRARLGSSQRRR